MTQLAISRCRRHAWLTADGVSWCGRCGVEATAAVKRGRSTRDYGNRAELDVARTYGGVKKGHHGGPVDVEGKDFITQVKTTRRPVPRVWDTSFRAMSGRTDRFPRLWLRFLRPGNLGPDDYIVMRARDFLDWFGKDEEDAA